MAMMDGGVDILLTDGAIEKRLRVAVSLDGRSPEVAWRAFLDKLFRHFDRDSDGYLSKVEAERIFPLPLSSGGEAKAEFKKLDANGDGRVAPVEFEIYYRATGYAPIVVVI